MDGASVNRFSQVEPFYGVLKQTKADPMDESGCKSFAKWMQVDKHICGAACISDAVFEFQRGFVEKVEEESRGRMDKLKAALSGRETLHNEDEESGFVSQVSCRKNVSSM